MKYFEADTFYDAVPAWAATALSLGYRWNLTDSTSRRIGLLSMPCDSEAAGLITLGALRRDLEHASANHMDTHFDLLLRSCHERTRARIHSEASKEEAGWDVRHVVDDTCWRFVDYHNELDAIVLEDARHRPLIKRKGKSIPNQNGACSRYLLRSHAAEWQLRDFPLPQMAPGEKGLEMSDYIDLPGCTGPIAEANLSRSYEGLVLVGSGAARDSSYMQKFYTTGFAIADRKLPLGNLLTLHHNERKYIQRMRFLNTHSQHNKAVYPAKLVVADGIQALLSAEKLFSDSDIIGVCNRDAPVEAILQLKDFLNDKVRYYSDLDISGCLSGEMPAGMLLRVLQRKT